MVLIETVGQKNKNPRLWDLAAQNSRIWDAKKHKKTRFRDSSKTPSRFRDWNKNFRDPEFSGYHCATPTVPFDIRKFRKFKPEFWSNGTRPLFAGFLLQRSNQNVTQRLRTTPLDSCLLLRRFDSEALSKWSGRARSTRNWARLSPSLPPLRAHPFRSERDVWERGRWVWDDCGRLWRPHEDDESFPEVTPAVHKIVYPWFTSFVLAFVRLCFRFQRKTCRKSLLATAWKRYMVLTRIL